MDPPKVQKTIESVIKSLDNIRRRNDIIENRFNSVPLLIIFKECERRGSVLNLVRLTSCHPLSHTF